MSNKSREIVNLNLHPLKGLYLNEHNGQTFEITHTNSAWTHLYYPAFFDRTLCVKTQLYRDDVVKMILTGKITFIGEV